MIFCVRHQSILLLVLLIQASAFQISNSHTETENIHPSFEEQKTPEFGGEGGANFQWAIRHSQYELSEIRIKSGSQIDQISLIFRKGNLTLQSPIFGGNGGTWRAWIIPSGQKVSQIRVKSGALVDALTFITNQGQSSGKFGGNGGGNQEISIPEDYKIIGLYGRSSGFLDSIGFILEKRTETPMIISSEERIFAPDMLEASQEMLVAPQQRLQSTKNCGDSCRLPAYLGSGYDAFKGNPESEVSFDPGFRSPVFKLSYANSKRTQDRNYIIPDQALSRITSACFLSSKTAKLSGTKSYQNQLKTKVSLSDTDNDLILSAAFSVSDSYDHMKKKTLNQSSVVVHTSSQCEVYRLTMGTFIENPLQENFIKAVNQSFKNKNWTRFIGQFGTHVAYDIVFGGTAIHHYEYSQESASKLQNAKVDIEAAAKLHFASYYGDTSASFSNFKRSSDYSKNEVRNIQRISIGGQPEQKEENQKGDIAKWKQNVVDNPMPLFIGLTPITNLFQKILNSDDLDTAKTQFQKDLNIYCVVFNCTKEQLDKNIPQTSVKFDKTTSWGGNGGGPFSWKPIRLNYAFAYVKSVMVRFGAWVDQISLKMGDGVEQQFSDKYGGENTGMSTWDVPQGHQISQIIVKKGLYVDYLRFITNKGRQSPGLGRDRSDGSKIFTVAKGWKVIGIFGASGRYLDSIGFHLAKTEFL